MGRLYCDVVIVVQSNDELKKMLLEMQGQGNQGAAVAALEMIGAAGRTTAAAWINPAALPSAIVAPDTLLS